MPTCTRARRRRGSCSSATGIQRTTVPPELPASDATPNRQHHVDDGLAEPDVARRGPVPIWLSVADWSQRVPASGKAQIGAGHDVRPSDGDAGKASKDSSSRSHQWSENAAGKTRTAPRQPQWRQNRLEVPPGGHEPARRRRRRRSASPSDAYVLDDAEVVFWGVVRPRYRRTQFQARRCTCRHCRR